MHKVAQITSIAFAAVVLVVVVSVCAEAFACSVCTSQTCCAEAIHAPSRRATTALVAKLACSAGTAETATGVPVLVVAVQQIDARMAAPPPDRLLANLRI